MINPITFAGSIPGAPVPKGLKKPNEIVVGQPFVSVNDKGERVNFTDWSDLNGTQNLTINVNGEQYAGRSIETTGKVIGLYKSKEDREVQGTLTVNRNGIVQDIKMMEK